MDDGNNNNSLALLLQKPAENLGQLAVEINSFLIGILGQRQFSVYLSAARTHHSRRDAQPYIQIIPANANSENDTTTRLLSRKEIEVSTEPQYIHRIGFEQTDVQNWFEFLIVSDAISAASFSKEIAPIIRNRIVSCLVAIRISVRSKIVQISLRSRDLHSFLHRCITEIITPTFACEGVSLFYRAESDEYLTLGATSGIAEMERHNLKRSDIKYFLDSKSFTSRCFNTKDMIIEDMATKRPLLLNTYGEKASHVVSRVYFPLKIKEPPERDSSDGLMGVLRMINAHKDESFRPFDCIDVDIMSYLAELITVLGNRYLRNISILHDQERATHGFSTDLLTIRMATELNLRHAENLEKVATQTLSRIESAASSDPRLKAMPIAMESQFLEVILQNVKQISARCRDIFSIQDHMAEQLLQVLQTKENFFVHQVFSEVEACKTPYKTVFLRLLGAKSGLAKMFNREDILITSMGHLRFDDDSKAIPPLNITNSGMYTIVRNLTENAIKYCDPDKIPRLDIRWTREGSKIHFHFHDSGIGISERDESKLFAEGFRGLEAQRMQLRGNGIGLFLSREIARRFAGDLQYVRPTSAGGSIFKLSLNVHGA